MHLASLVIYGSVLLETRGDRPVVNNNGSGTHKRSHDNLQNVQELSRVSGTISEQSVCFNNLDVLVSKHLVFSQSSIQ